MNEKKPLIVVYMHKLPYPVGNGTNQRIYSMIGYLKNDYRVGLVIPEYHPEMGKLTEVFDYIWYGGKFLNFYAKLHRYTLRYLYIWFFNIFFKQHLLSYKNNPLGKYNVFAAVALYKVCLTEKPALIIVQKVINSVLSTAIAHKYNIPVIIDTHDLYKLEFTDQKEKINVNLVQFPQLTSQHEKDLLQLYDALIAIQYREEAILKHHFPDKKIITALHPVSQTFLNSNIEHIFNDKPTLLFVASGSVHNIDAIKYFIEDQFEYILKYYPAVFLNICGDINKHINYVHSNIRLLGKVENLKPLYDQATMVINPVRFGAGLKIKTIDALAAGKCLVTTPNGIEGLPDVNDALVCVESDQIGKRIVELLTDRNRIRSYELEAHCYAKNKLTIEHCYSDLKILIEDLALLQ